MNKPDYKTVFITSTATPEFLELRADLKHSLGRAGDTETEYREALTKDNMPGPLRVISIATRRADGSVGSYVIDVRDIPKGDERLSQLFTNEDGSLMTIDGYNANFDDTVLSTAGIPVLWWDVQFADSILRTGRAGITFHRPLSNVAYFDLEMEIDGKGEIQTSYDMECDLTEEQVTYAASDAVVTLLGGELMRARLADEDARFPGISNLVDTADFMMKSRRWVHAMMSNGVPVQYAQYLADRITPHRVKMAELAHELALLTGQVPDDEDVVDISSGTAVETKRLLTLDWNPGSVADVRRILNTYEKERVQKRYGRPLNNTDTLRTNDMKLIGGDLVKVIVEYKKLSKIVTTYGDSLDEFVRDNRIFSRYAQGITATGRWNSFATNAQNFSPEILKYMGPSTNVLVYGDISQAELRVLAALAGDIAMLAAFENPDGDFHTDTAQSMFPELNLLALKTEDPSLFAAIRGRAKSVSFGIPYGIGAAKLAEDMTAKGSPITAKETKALLAAYRKAYQQLSAWLDARDAYITNLASNLPEIDWKQTFKLFKIRSQADTISRSLKRSKGSRTLSLAGVLSTDNLLAAGLLPAEILNVMKIIGAKELRAPSKKKKLTSTEQLVKDLLPAGEYGTFSSQVGNFISAFAPSVIGHDAYKRLGLSPQAGPFRLLSHLGWTSEQCSAASVEVCGLGRYPSVKEIATAMFDEDAARARLATAYDIEPAAVVAEELALEKAALATDIKWALGFTDAVVLLKDGTPFEWYSFTKAGRRRAFNITFGAAAKQKEDGQRSSDPYSGILINALFDMLAVASPSGFLAKFSEDHNLSFPQASDFQSWDKRGQARAKVIKALEGTIGAALKLLIMESAIEKFGWPRMEGVFTASLASNVRAAKNMYRNHCIQGSVADVVERATAKLMEPDMLSPQDLPIMSVHDSLCIEVVPGREELVSEMLTRAVNSVFHELFPSVKPKTDVEIKHRLKD